jgi:hypothetical protein
MAFKSWVLAVARGLFNLNVHSGTVLPLLDEKDLHKVGHFYTVCLLNVNNAVIFMVVRLSHFISELSF